MDKTHQAWEATKMGNEDEFFKPGETQNPEDTTKEQDDAFLRDHFIFMQVG